MQLVGQLLMQFNTTSKNQTLTIHGEYMTIQEAEDKGLIKTDVNSSGELEIVKIS